MIRCMAIDDEPLALQQITAYIGKVPFLELAAQCLARKYGKDEAEKRLKKLIALEEHTLRGFLPVDYFGQIRNQLIKIISEAK